MIAFFIVVYNYDIMMSMVKKPDIKKVQIIYQTQQQSRPKIHYLRWNVNKGMWRNLG